jgi:hypothetical protein
VHPKEAIVDRRESVASNAREADLLMEHKSPLVTVD